MKSQIDEVDGVGWGGGRAAGGRLLEAAMGASLFAVPNAHGGPLAAVRDGRGWRAVEGACAAGACAV